MLPSRHNSFNKQIICTLNKLFTFIPPKALKMKKNIFLLLLPLLLCLAGCKKDDDQHTNPVDQLPPATQTGAGTFAALVDGKPFIDHSGGWFNCYYQYVDGGYYFNIRGVFQNQNTLDTFALGTESKTISEGEILQLLERQEGNAWGGGHFHWI
jgi:hypothetical protein